MDDHASNRSRIPSSWSSPGLSPKHSTISFKCPDDIVAKQFQEAAGKFLSEHRRLVDMYSALKSEHSTLCRIVDHENESQSEKGIPFERGGTGLADQSGFDPSSETGQPLLCSSVSAHSANVIGAGQNSILGYNDQKEASPYRRKTALSPGTPRSPNRIESEADLTMFPSKETGNGNVLITNSELRDRLYCTYFSHIATNAQGVGHLASESRPPLSLLQQFALCEGWIRPQFHSAKLGLTSIVNSHWFDSICALVIVLNSVVIAFNTDFAARQRIADQHNMPSFYTILDYIFGLWFFLELLARIYAEGPRMFWSQKSPQWSWNVFDTVVVGMNAIETTLQLLGFGFAGNLTTLRMLRVLRVARAVRVLRLVHLFKGLRMMVLCILKSATTLLWSMVLLALTMFIFGVLLTQNVTIALHDGEDTDSNASELASLEDYFGSLSRATYVLFLSVTGGIDWSLVSDLLFRISWINGMIWVFYIFFTTLAMLNIISGIFLDSAMTAAHTDKDECISEQLRSDHSTINEMHQIFFELTQGKLDAITVAEFDRHLLDPRMRAHLATLGLETSEVKGLFRLLDMDDSGTVTAEEFLYGCMRVKGGAKAVDVATLLYENKRMVDKFNKFSSFVEKQFKLVRAWESRIEAVMQAHRHRLPRTSARDGKEDVWRQESPPILESPILESSFENTRHEL